MDRCHAKSKRSGDQCKKAPMRGKRVCYFHGGASTGPKQHHMPAGGRYSLALQNQPEMLERYERMCNDPKFTETLNEIAWLRALLDNYVTQYGRVTHPKSLEVMAGFADTISKLMERRHKMAYGEQVTITQRDFETLVKVTLETVRRVYGSDDRYRELLQELTKLNVYHSSQEGTSEA